MILVNNVYQVIDRSILVADKNLAVQNLVIPQDIVKHLLIQVLGRRLKGDLHASSLFGLEIDVATIVSEIMNVRARKLTVVPDSVLCQLPPIQPQVVLVARLSSLRPGPS